MLTRKQIVLPKIETAYGTDPTPDGSSVVRTTSDLTWTPYQGETQTRDRLRDHFGATAEVNVGPNASLQFSVPLAGSGAAGTAPSFGPLLRACGLSETVGVDVVYQPVTADPESVALYYFLDGVKQVMLGARGTVVINMNAGEFPTLEFTFTSMYNRPTGVAAPATTLSNQADEIPVNKQNTVGSVFGFAACMAGMSLDMGNSVTYRNQINCEHIDLTGREATGSTTIDAPDIATKDYFKELESHSGLNTGIISVTHGATAGNIVELNAPKAQLSSMSIGDSDGIVQYEFDTRFLPDTGDDEFTLTFK